MKTVRAYLKLFFGLFLIWLFAWHIGPFLVANIPALARIDKIAEENDIMPSALYYNDVPVTIDAERNNRDTVRFLPHGGGKKD